MWGQLIDDGVMVQTPVVGSQFGSFEGMLNAIAFVPETGGWAFDALIACLRVQVAPHVEPSSSAVEVTVKVNAGVAVGVGVGVGVAVAVAVGVDVGVGAGVDVAVAVGVDVAVGVIVGVGVSVASAVYSSALASELELLSTPPATSTSPSGSNVAV